MGKTIKVSAFFIPLAICLVLLNDSGFDPKSVRDQRVLITGASGGIGEQLAYQYARLGARLVITARREELLQNVSRICKGLGAQDVQYIAADMANPDDRHKVVAFAEKRFQGGLDHLILNHAILFIDDWTGSPENLATLDLVMRVNFFSYVELASVALPLLIASRGKIGIVSSGFGEIATVNTSAYSSSKFALHGFFSSLRQELRHKNTGVSVTFTVLGPVATSTFWELNGEKLPAKMVASPNDAARAILESVNQRLYKVRFDWKIRVMLLINDFFPVFSEDLLPSFILNENMTWTASLLRLLVDNFG